LPGVHENAFIRSCKISGTAHAVDQEEPVRKLRRFDPDLVVEDTEVRRDRRAVDMSHAGRKIVENPGQRVIIKGQRSRELAFAFATAAIWSSIAVSSIAVDNNTQAGQTVAAAGSISLPESLLSTGARS